MFSNLRYKVVALVAALLLWGVSHSTSSVERGFDIPVVPGNVPEDLVITGQSTDAVNIRVRATNAALRRLSVAELSYAVKGSNHGIPLMGTGTISWQQADGRYTLLTEARSGLFGKVLT